MGGEKLIEFVCKVKWNRQKNIHRPSFKVDWFANNNLPKDFASEDCLKPINLLHTE